MMRGEGDPDQAVLSALQGYIESGIVTGFVLIAEFTDSDGDQRIIADSMTNQRCHRTLGLLQFGLAVESAKAADAWRHDDEDD